MRFVAALKRTLVGYQPVGMKPSALDLPRSATLSTARLLASALATNNIWPSGVRARLFGVLPDGADGYRAQLIVSSALPFSASRTLTRVELAQATYRVLPSGDSTISVGWLSVFQVAVTLPASRSTTATAEPAHRLTSSRLPSGIGRQVQG